MNYLLSNIILILCLGITSAHAEPQRLRMATTTSTDNSGLLSILHAPFEKQTGIKVDVIAVGTGKALRLGQNGDVDLVMVHAPAAEKQFVRLGYGVERLPVMHNNFVMLGPPQDPAGLSKTKNIHDALKQITQQQATFISRGDDSGTHKKELSLWHGAGIQPKGNWYLATGQGMGAVIKIADDKRAYTLADKGTYLAFKDKISLIVVFSNSPELYNPYHIILINPKRHPHVKTELAQAYADYIRGPQGQQLIGDFQRSGEQLFYPDVTP